MSDVELLKQHLKELRTKLYQCALLRNKIEVESWKDTKRLLSIAVTNLETSILYLEAAIKEQESLPPQRFG